MKILFIHPNMPGQYKHLVREFAQDKNNEVVFITKPKPKIEIEGVQKIEYQTNREPHKNSHSFLVTTEVAVLRGQEVWRTCQQLKEQGFTPDVICAHPGWGDGMFLKEVYPETPILFFMEYYYLGYEDKTEFEGKEISAHDRAKIRCKNNVHLQNFIVGDWFITPTIYQRDVHPEVFHKRMTVLHDGIDTETCKPLEHKKKIKFPDGAEIDPDKDEIITYAARNLEPYRGFPQFMKALEILCKERPNAHFVIVGGDEVSYGASLPNGQTYKQKMLAEVEIDETRVHFLPRIPYNLLIQLMQVSSAHIYLTYPFVLSWSMLEAMSIGCAMICSNTDPVQEVAKDRENMLLCDFHNPHDIAAKTIEALDNKELNAKLRKNARQTIIDKYDLKTLLNMHVELIKDIAQGQANNSKTPKTALEIAQWQEKRS